MVAVFIFFDQTGEIVCSDIHTSVSPAYYSYIWLLPATRPAMYGRYHVYPLSECGCGISVQLVPHLGDQLLSLFVQVWWS